MSIRHLISPTGCCLPFLACLLAASPASLAGDRYKIDPAHTFSSFEYTHWGLSQQRGRFDKNAGMIEFDPETKTGAIDIQINIASVNTGTAMFDEILRSEQFFDAAQFPNILFKSKALRFDEDKLTKVEGDLTIKEITRPVIFEITHFACRFMVIYMRRACGANGYTKILRSDFNIGRFVPFVSDAVTLHFSLEAIRTDAAGP